MPNDRDKRNKARKLQTARLYRWEQSTFRQGDASTPTTEVVRSKRPHPQHIWAYIQDAADSQTGIEPSPRKVLVDKAILGYTAHNIVATEPYFAKRFVKRGPLVTKDACQVYVDMVWRVLGAKYPPRVAFSGRRWCRSFSLTNTIELATWGRCIPVIIHELAHIRADADGYREGSHGPHFARVLVDMVVQFVPGWNDRSELVRKALLHGVEIEGEREMTEEQLHAAALNGEVVYREALS